MLRVLSFSTRRHCKGGRGGVVDMILSQRQRRRRLLRLAMIVLSAVMIWKSLMVITNSRFPVLVVLSGGWVIPPYRGDMLFLHNCSELVVGDVIAVQIRDHVIPSTHRIVTITTQSDHDKLLYYLTKGDDNRVDDRGLYAPGKMWLTRDEIYGKVVGIIPKIGWFILFLEDFPMFKFILWVESILSILWISQRKWTVVLPSSGKSLFISVLVWSSFIQKTYC